MLLSQSQGLAARIIGHPRKAEIPAVLVPRCALPAHETMVVKCYSYTCCRVLHWSMSLGTLVGRMRVVSFVKCVRPLTRHRYCTKPYSRRSCSPAQGCQIASLNPGITQTSWQRLQVKNCNLPAVAMAGVNLGHHAYIGVGVSAALEIVAVEVSFLKRSIACRRSDEAVCADPILCMNRAEQGVAAPLKEEQDAVLNSLPDDIPKPVIKIDNQHDPFATVVTIEYGDRLGELLDTVSLSSLAVACVYRLWHQSCSHDMILQALMRGRKWFRPYTSGRGLL